MLAGLRPGETLLVHGGAPASARWRSSSPAHAGARVAVTAGSAEKLERCRELGAEILVNYREQDFVEEVRAATDGRGADVVLDNMGAKYLARNVDVLAVNGRLVVIGMQGGTKAELDLGLLLRKAGAVLATTLRAAAGRREGRDRRRRSASTSGRCSSRGDGPAGRRPGAPDGGRRRGPPRRHRQRACGKGAARRLNPDGSVVPRPIRP